MDKNDNMPKGKGRKPLPKEKVKVSGSGKLNGQDGRSSVDILAAALQILKRGWKIFPAPQGEKSSHKAAKHSGGRNWGMTNDPAEVKRDWRQWPQANIGLPTGNVNGIFVVETDTRKAHPTLKTDGAAGLAGLEAEHSPLPATLIAVSPTGSVHYYFNHPGVLHPGDGVWIKNSASEIATGVDVRGDGGMVICPPSVRYDGAYRWLNDLPIADAPEWLVKLCTKKPYTNLPSGPSTIDADKLAAAMADIPNPDVDWEEWNDKAMAVWEGTRGDPIGLEIFDTWSQKSKKYNMNRTAAKWDAITGCPPDRITGRSVIFWAEQARPGWEREYDAAQTRAAFDRIAARRAAQIKHYAAIGDEIIEPSLPTIMTIPEMEQQLIYIGSSGAVVHRPTGRIRKKEHAPGEYAASKYVPKNGKKAVRCLPVWIDSAKRVTRDALAWVPGEPELCRVPEEFDGHKTGYNTWRGLDPLPYPENWQELAQIFLDHVAYLVPVETEYRRYLQWLAHIAQQPEILPHTDYLMITPTQGTGRNWQSSVLLQVFRGHVASGITLSELLDDNFNGRFAHKLLYIIDEVHEGSGPHRYQQQNKLKRTTTQEYRRINPKFGLQTIEKNCMRGLKYSNYWDAIPFDNGDRRIQVIANPTEPREPAYYERIYGILPDPMFIGSVRRLMETLDISDFKPGANATMNEAKVQAITQMKSELDEELDNFKESHGHALASRKAIDVIVPAGYSSAHVNHAIADAGMVNTGRQIIGRDRKKHKVVIVDRTQWTLQMVMKASVPALIKAMGVNDEPPREVVVTPEMEAKWAKDKAKKEAKWEEAVRKRAEERKKE
jgi:Bifunctional DNA primase/polymerase, N-terminal/Primase C terminal 2 (PriCT-2)/Family of unknown function (DUF5906)